MGARDWEDAIPRARKDGRNRGEHLSCLPRLKLTLILVVLAPLGRIPAHRGGLGRRLLHTHIAALTEFAAEHVPPANTDTQSNVTRVPLPRLAEGRAAPSVILIRRDVQLAESEPRA